MVESSPSNEMYHVETQGQVMQVQVSIAHLKVMFLIATLLSAFQNSSPQSFEWTAPASCEVDEACDQSFEANPVQPFKSEHHHVEHCCCAHSPVFVTSTPHHAVRLAWTRERHILFETDDIASGVPRALFRPPIIS